LIVNIATVLVAGFAIFATLHGVRDQLRTSTFLVYTDRYSQIMNKLPFDARRPGSAYQFRSLPRPEQVEVLSTFRSYLNLCSEERWLFNAGRIDKKTWAIWREMIKQVMKFPCFDEIWNELKVEYQPFADFINFMDALSSE